MFTSPAFSCDGDLAPILFLKLRRLETPLHMNLRGRPEIPVGVYVNTLGYPTYS